MLDTSTSDIKKCHESREPSRPNQQPLLMLLATPRFLIDLTFSIPGIANPREPSPPEPHKRK